MKKLSLSLEALCVESFETVDAPRGRGTVAALGTDDTLKPDCDVSGEDSCMETYCGDYTCHTCGAASFCGPSCILVCDGDVEAEPGVEVGIVRW